MGKPRQRARKAHQHDGNKQSKPGKPARELKSQQNDERGQYSTNICAVLFLFMLAFLAGALVVGYYTSPIKALEIVDIPPVVEFERNSRLTKGEINKNIRAGESIEEDKDGNLYTSQIDGKIVRIAPSSDGKVGFGEITTIAEIKIKDEEAKVKGLESNNGRPLGLRLFGNTLYGADAHFGLFKINLKTSELTHLVAMEDANPHMMFPDDLAVTADERKIYFTDASATFHIGKLMLLALKGICDGRVFEYDTKTNELTEVLSGLCFPNGVQLTKNEKQLMVIETFGLRLSFYDIATWSRNKVTRLPAMPDNIRPSSKGTYWVAASAPRAKMNVWLDQSPVVRQIIAGLFSGQQMMKTLPKFCMVMEVNENGDILQTLQDPNGKLASGLSQVTELKDGRLALGSYIAPFMSFLNPTHSKPVGSNP